MGAASLGSLAPTFVVLALIVLVMARRTYAVARGTRYSAGRLFGYAAFSAAVFGLFAASTLFVAVGAWGTTADLLLAPYAGVVAAAAVVAEPRVRRLVRFEPREGGSLYYRLPFVVPMISFGLFVARLAVELLLLGPAVFASATLPGSLPTASLAVLVAFDLAYGVSVGLLWGRATGVYRAYGARPPPAAASPPLA